MSLPPFSRVAVDGLTLEDPAGTGIRQYASELLVCLCELELKPDVLWSGAEMPQRTKNKIPLLSRLGFDRRAVVSPKGGWVCDQIYAHAYREFKKNGKPVTVRLPEPVAVWHSTLPLPVRVRGARMICTIHDMIPVRLPETTLTPAGPWLNLVRAATRDASLILAVSGHTRSDLVELTGIHADRVVVTYQSVPDPEPVEPAEAASLLRRFNCETGGYFLYLGNLEPKKNVARLIEAFAALKTERKLVIAGRKAWLAGEVEAAAARWFPAGDPRLIFTGAVTEQEKSVWYQHAFAFVFPSLYEGFGLPPVEAMTHGCPVITSNVSSLPEICGSAALYVNPLSLDGICQGMKELEGNERFRRELGEKGRERAAFFSRDRYVERLRAAYSVLDIPN